MDAGIGGFVARIDPPLTFGDGPCAGLRLAVKDNFDLTGFVTGCGNPEWAATHGPATQTAPVVRQLLDLGATVVGKTHMDELAYSLMGQNARYGTPVNPAAPDRMPGGSSSGSAVAVAAGEADIGLGTDTGGSVRIPAAFCGLYGWRPTHGMLSAEGIVPLAMSYDVPGFMTRDVETLQSIADHIAPEAAPLDGPARCPPDLWQTAGTEPAKALLNGSRPLDAPLLPEAIFETLLATFRVCQGAEVAETFGDWISRTDPAFGPGIKDRFAAALGLSPAEISEARAQRAVITAHLIEALGDDGLVMFPTAPGPAPLLTTSGAEMEAYRNAALTLLCVAGHAGLPQVTIPRRNDAGLPVGLSIVGPRNSDRALIDVAASLG